MTARILVRPRAALHRARVGPVSPEYTNPRVPSWITKPTVGTVCVTATGVTHRSPTRCSASSTSVRYLTTGVVASGIRAKSGHTTLLNTDVFRASTIGAVHSNLHIQFRLALLPAWSPT